LTEPILALKGVRKAFGGVAAVDGVSFEVFPREILAVIGPNGAGKTTLFNLITGALKMDEGDVLLKGHSLKRLAPHQVVKLGIARTFQNVQLFGNMTVIENVMVGRHVRSRTGFLSAALSTPAARAEERTIREKAMESLAFVGLQDKAQEPALGLPFGQQRLLAIARALASEPQVLLLDEPGAGLNATETAELGRLILSLREMGITIMLVEHDMNLVMTIADRVIVLDYGVLIAEGPPSLVQNDARVIAAYLGDDLDL